MLWKEEEWGWRRQGGWCSGCGWAEGGGREATKNGSTRWRCGASFCFFSSRRRHTRYWRDWSSDVCSSDLSGADRLAAVAAVGHDLLAVEPEAGQRCERGARLVGGDAGVPAVAQLAQRADP